MADFWKSQAKKFCDFCKCWIADNKPSVGFHESGKRHKENVAKRLSEISKHSAKSHMESLQVDQEMKTMEKEALKAYLKDLQENPDFTSKQILEETERRKKELEESVRQKQARKEDQPVEAEETPVETATGSGTSTSREWLEAKSDEGYTYYWHTTSAESRWEPPEEGFLSLADQEKEQRESTLKQEMKKRKKEEKAKRKEEMKHSKKKKTTDKDQEESYSTVVGPAPKADPYGSWSTIEPVVEEPLDLQLPYQEYVAIKVPELHEPDLQIQFKEKTIDTVDIGGVSYHGFVKQEGKDSFETFKKRKFKQGNMRQKLDTD